MILLMSLPSAWQIWLLWSRIVYQLGCSKLGDIPSFTRFYWLLLNWLDSCYRLWWFFPVSLDSFRRIGDPILAATFIVGFSCTFSLTLTVFWIGSSKLTLSIIARWYQQDSEPSSGQGIELRLLLLRLGLGRALGSSCRWCRPSSWWRSAWASWPQRPRGWYRYLPGQDQVTEHHRGLVQALLLNESILVQSNSLDDLASPFTKTDMRKKPCLMLMLLSHVRKPPSLPNRLNLCSVRLTSKLSRSNMAHEDFRIWNY